MSINQIDRPIHIQTTSIKHFIGPISRCILVLILLSTSTGVLIQRLIVIAATDLLALIVGIFWFLGDILPCVSIIIMVIDLFILGKNDNVVLLTVKGRTLTISNAIIILFAILYSADFIILATCYTRKLYNNSSYQKSDNILTNYRYVFFHIQILISILYAAKPWLWTQVDLRAILSKIQRSNVILHHLATSISTFLDPSRQSYLTLGTEVPPRPVQDVSVKVNETYATKEVQGSKSELRHTDGFNKSLGKVHMPSKQAPVRSGSIKKVVTRKQTQGRIGSSRRLRVRGRQTAVNRSTRKSLAIVTTTTSRGSASRRRVIARTRGFCHSARLLAIKRIRCGSLTDSSRTINVNLNMN